MIAVGWIQVFDLNFGDPGAGSLAYSMELLENLIRQKLGPTKIWSEKKDQNLPLYNLFGRNMAENPIWP